MASEPASQPGHLTPFLCLIAAITALAGVAWFYMETVMNIHRVATEEAVGGMFDSLEETARRMTRSRAPHADSWGCWA